MPRLKPWPVLVGALVDLLGTIVVVLLYMSIVLPAQFWSGDVPAEPLTPVHQAVGDGLGLLMSVLGGFLAGRLAKIDEVHHGAAAGFASLVLSLLLSWGLPADGALSWRDVVVSLTVVPAAALGGYIAARLNARIVPPPTP
jgi:hypothetical protein